MHIDGPAGQLESRFDQAPEQTSKQIEHAGRITAILCHPHPQYGGSMHDAVLQTAVDVLLATGINCLRFNFRGVGASEGHYEEGIGEAADLLAVSAWVAAQQPAGRLWWVGYSFGAAVVWRALSHHQASPQRAVLIAPPVGVMDFSQAAPASLPIDAIAGDRDDYVDQQKLSELAGVTAHVIPAADHFFAGHHDALADALASVAKTD